MFRLLVNYVFPPRCFACSNLTSDHDGICSSCWKKCKFITKPFCRICCKKFEVNFSDIDICVKCSISKPKIDSVRALLEFSSEVKGLIHNFKYNNKTILGKFFAKLIYNRFSDDFKDVDIIAPVPMHRIKRLFRGYNPPQILAYELAKFIHKPVIPDLLIKKRLTKAQVGLNKKERAKNLQGSLLLNKKFDVKDKVILLVDDVVTTGATGNECSKVLKQEKAMAVNLVTIAKR